MLALSLLLVEPPMPDRSRVMNQSGDTRVVQAGGWGVRLSSLKNHIAEKPNNGRRKDNTGQRNDRNVRIT